MPARIPGLCGGRNNSTACTETNFLQIVGVCGGVSHLRLCGGTAVSRAKREFWRASGTRKRELPGVSCTESEFPIRRPGTYRKTLAAWRANRSDRKGCTLMVTLARALACRARVLLAKVPIALKRAVGLSGPSSSRQSAPILQQWSEQVCRSFEAGQAMSHSDANCAKPRTGFRSRPAPSTVARACARYGVLVVGEEMKGLVNCNFLPGSARRLELGTVSAEPLSRAYWSQKLRPLGETVEVVRASRPIS